MSHLCKLSHRKKVLENFRKFITVSLKNGILEFGSKALIKSFSQKITINFIYVLQKNFRDRVGVKFFSLKLFQS